LCIPSLASLIYQVKISCHIFSWFAWKKFVSYVGTWSHLDDSLSFALLDDNVAVDSEGRACRFGITNTSIGVGQVAVVVLLTIFEET